jgi:siderophore synthetase component
LHWPTFQRLGIQLPGSNAASPVATDNLEDVWHKFHHSFLQNHLAALIIGLELESRGGWAIVREELTEALASHNQAEGAGLLQYLLADEMQFVCFFTSRWEGASPYGVSWLEIRPQGFHVD